MTPADRERLSEVLAGLEDTTHHNHGEWTTQGHALLAEARAIVNQPAPPPGAIEANRTEMQQAIIDAFNREPRGSLMSLGPPRTIDLTLPGPLGRLWATIKRATSALTHPKGKS